MIVYSSNKGSSREYLKEYLKKKKQENPNFKVLDIGGAANPWAGDLIDAFIDVVDVPGQKVFKGSVFSDELWAEVAKEQWDFCICSHLLEDIRDPNYVINKITEIFPEGYIAMPNKHSEFSTAESIFYPGFCHHRWIFTLEGEHLKAIGKFPITSYYSPFYFIFHFIFKFSFFRKVAEKLFRGKFRLFWPATYRPKWIDSSLGKGFNELAFIWKDNFNFSYINDDFCGESYYELAHLYHSELENGL